MGFSGSYSTLHHTFLGDKMKLTFPVIAALFASLFVVSAGAQTTAPPVAVTPATPIKMGIIDTEAFTDTKNGIKRLVNAFAQIDIELKPKRDEIVNMNNRLQALAQKANAGTLTQAEADEADNLKRDIQRKQEDGQKLLETLTRQRTTPFFTDLNTALQNYAKMRGFDMVVDVSKIQGSILLINQSIDITNAFITDFNAKNPGTTTAAATPTKP
jgi:Skp family chaperone for outer membrane proteins